MAGRTTLGKIGSLLLCGTLAGAVVAAIAFPVSAAVGLSAKVAGERFQDLPSSLRIPPAQQATYLYANDGKTLITTFYDENRRDVPLTAIAPVMRQAIVAAEDSRFYRHGGVDLESIARSLVANYQGGEVQQGASTLTMQYVRNVLKDDPNRTPQERLEATEDSPQRKLREMRYALALEQKLSKDDILDRYLNISYFGDGAYGIDAASRTYFSKPPSQLTLPEAAMLAGLVRSPDAENPVTGDKDAALRRRAYVLASMAKMHAVGSGQATRAAAEPLDLHPSQAPNDCAAVPANHNDWGFFCDYLRQWWDQQPAFGATVGARENALERGGYTVVTSLDPGIQASALKHSLGVYGYGNAKALPMAVVQPGSGRVLAMAVNRHYSLAANPPGQRNYPNTVNQLIAGGDGATGYQTGSTYKLFTMLAALQAGKPLSTAFDAPSPLTTKWPSDGEGNCGGYYCPINDNPSWMDGHRTMWSGYGRSVNTYFVWLEEQIGSRAAVQMAQALGIQFRAPHDAYMAANDADGWGSFTLGVVDTTPLELANAYATVAADGMYCAPSPVLSITGPDGVASPAANPSCHRAVSADVARGAVDAARCPVGQQSHFGRCDGGTAPDIANILGERPVGGKTGSSQNNATESFVGFTPNLAAAATAADPDDPTDFVGYEVSEAVDDAVGWTMSDTLHGTAYKYFPAPSTTIAYGAGRSGDSDRGDQDGQPSPGPSRSSRPPG